MSNTLKLPFSSDGWDTIFEVVELVNGNWIPKGSFSGRDALKQYITDGFFNGREVAVLNNGEVAWTNIKKKKAS